MQTIRYLRRGDVLKQTGLSNSTFYKRISDGHFVPPVNLGERAVGWLEHEVNQVLAAIAAGHSADELQGLVRDLVQQRKGLAIVVQAVGEA